MSHGLQRSVHGLKIAIRNTELIVKDKRAFEARTPTLSISRMARRGGNRRRFLGRRGTVAILDRKEGECTVIKGFRSAGLNGKTCGQVVNTRNLPVASRKAALEKLRQSMGMDEPELALVTGEPGTGKTWLWRKLVQELPASWRCLAVEMSESLDALEFMRLVSHGLGIQPADRLGAARLDQSRALQDDSGDGGSWLLVVENAQSTPPQVWNEIQAMVHAMEASEGFAAIILVGPTKLAHLLAGRSLSALATRMGTHVHLLPLDLDESLELVQVRGNLGNIERATLEKLHRDVRGNPRLLLQLLRRTGWGPTESAIATPPATPRELPEPLARSVITHSNAVAARVPDASTTPAPESEPSTRPGALIAREPMASALSSGSQSPSLTRRGGVDRGGLGGKP